MRAIVDHLHRGDEEGGPGFDVVVLGYRGIGVDSKGEILKLKTPRFYTVCSEIDCVEPFKYVYEKYCKSYGRRAFGLGNSFGSNMMTLAFKKLDFLECFCFYSAIVDMPKCNVHIKTNMLGKMSEVFAEDLFQFPRDNIEVCTPFYKEKCGFDLREKVNQMQRDGSDKNIHTVFDTLYSPVMGFENLDDYCEKGNAYPHIIKIDKPTLYLNCEDDPAVMMDFLKSPFKLNPNVALATLPSGGHTSAFEHFYSMNQWMIKPILAYFNTFVD